MVIDSLGREALAERIGCSESWTEFVLYRGTREAADLTLTFALTGLGEAHVDDVIVQRITPLAPNVSQRAVLQSSQRDDASYPFQPAQQ
jgi:hypothetical protein